MARPNYPLGEAALDCRAALTGQPKTGRETADEARPFAVALAQVISVFTGDGDLIDNPAQASLVRDLYVRPSDLTRGIRLIRTATASSANRHSSTLPFVHLDGVGSDINFIGNRISSGQQLLKAGSIYGGKFINNENK